MNKTFCEKKSVSRLSPKAYPETKIAEFANSVDLDKVTHNESPQLDIHCLPSSL